MPAVKLILTMMGIKLRFSKKFLKKGMFFILFALLLGIVVIHNANSTIHKNAEGKLYTEVDSIPKNKVALLLGTGKYLKDGQLNLYFRYRVEAAAALFRAQKVDFILISGDNSRQGYDEPTDMKEALVGPSSILLSLMASGMNGQSFAFNGYLPIDKDERKASLKRLEKRAKEELQSQLFIETPYRNEALLQEMLQVLSPHTSLCVATNVTLPEEAIHTYTIGEWKYRFKELHLEKQPTIFILL